MKRLTEEKLNELGNFKSIEAIRESLNKTHNLNEMKIFEATELIMKEQERRLNMSIDDIYKEIILS